MSSTQELEERKAYISNLVDIQRRFIDLSETLRWEMDGRSIIDRENSLEHDMIRVANIM